MFVIVHENFVIWGPKAWNKLSFEDVLRTECEVEFVLPQNNNEQRSFIINQNTKLLKVVDTEMPTINPKTQKVNGPFWTFHDDHAERSFVAEDLSTHIVKDNLKGIIARNRYTKEIGGFKTTIQSTEVSIDTTRDGRQIFFDTYLSMSDLETINWKFPEGWLSVTKSDLEQIVFAGKTHIQTQFDWENTKNTEIDNASTLAELDAIDLGDPPVTNPRRRVFE